MEKEQDGKNWYFEGDELVIKKGKWIIDRYKKHLTPSSDKDRLKIEWDSLLSKAVSHYNHKGLAVEDVRWQILNNTLWNWILSHAKEIGELQ